MKNIAIILSMFLFAACDNFLSIKPKAEIVEHVYFETPAGFEDALYGVYSDLGNSTLYGENLTWGLLDVFAQYYRVSQPGEGATNRLTLNHEKLKATYSGIWSGTYEAIGYVNNILRNLERKDENSMRYYDLYKGEALALRAYLHFDLLRLFAPHIASKPKEEAIPYVKIYDALVTPFSTVEEVYGLVVKDLVEAESLMSADEDLFMYPRGYRIDRGFATCREIHLNLYAVQALLARVFWMKGDMDHALYYAKKVIDSEKFPLEDKLNMGEFVAGRISGKETIFGIYTTSALNSIKSAFYTYESTKTWLPANNLDECYAVAQEYGNDYRRDMWLRAPSGDDEDRTRRCMKIVNEKKIVSPNEYSPAVGTIEGINLIRIPEMYLIAAEALLDKDLEQAQAYFDALIESRGLVKYADRVGFRQLTMQDILDERRREFLQEGQYFFTLKRQNADLYIDILKKTVEGSDEMYTLLIPDEEFEYRYSVVGKK